MQRNDSYAAPQRAVHWIMALLIIAQIPAGLYMADLPWPAAGQTSPLKDNLYELHKSFGMVLFALACLRVAFRVVYGAPAYEASLTPLQRKVSGAVHHTLYALIFLVPLTGWIATSMCCAPVNLFYSVPLTLPFSGDLDSAKPIYLVHKWLAIFMGLLVLAHIGAALMHLIVIKDGVFRRMWPGRS
ncbi:MAG: cytochrome b [Alphaproteobacteria bacterium]